MLIPEGAKVKFRLLGCDNPYFIKTFTANSDIKVQPNTIIVIDGGLYCTDSQLTGGMHGKDYVVDVYMQDAMYASEDTLYQSIGDV